MMTHWKSKIREEIQKKSIPQICRIEIERIAQVTGYWLPRALKTGRRSNKTKQNSTQKRAHEANKTGNNNNKRREFCWRAFDGREFNEVTKGQANRSEFFLVRSLSSDRLDEPRWRRRPRRRRLRQRGKKLYTLKPLECVRNWRLRRRVEGVRGREEDRFCLKEFGAAL